MTDCDCALVLQSQAEASRTFGFRGGATMKFRARMGWVTFSRLAAAMFLYVIERARLTSKGGATAPFA